MSVNYASWVVIDNSRVMLQNVASLTDDPRGIIYNCNVFIAQGTGVTHVVIYFKKHKPDRFILKKNSITVKQSSFSIKLYA
jgi:hypothetical protein